MEIKVMNQFTQVWEVDSEQVTDVYRTYKTLEQLKKDIENKSAYITDGKWSDDGQVEVVYALIADSMNDINRVRTFNKNGLTTDFGERGYYTLDEIKEGDLVFVKDFGVVDDENINEFEEKFNSSPKISAQ